ncbi:MAG TPA: hypothetical protein VFC90_03695 [Planctomycetota bacterium]|nr:hypothetical protein [Planctomycetota bacterium]
MWIRMLAVALLTGTVAAQSAQEPSPGPDAELEAAIKATAAGGFAYLIKPVADIPNFNSARDELAGAPVKGEFNGDMYHAQDGKYEIYRLGAKVAVKTQGGWLPIDQFASPLRQAIKEAFDSGDGRYWRKGNVTKGRQALSEIIRLDHLVHRADVSRLTNLAGAFVSMRAVGKPTIDGKPGILYEGEMNDTTAFSILQGPFDELVSRGNLSFQNVSGVCRFWIQEGKVRKIHGRVGGKYGFYNEDDNAHRKGICVLDVHAELNKFGETKVEPPKEAMQILGR